MKKTSLQCIKASHVYVHMTLKARKFGQSRLSGEYYSAAAYETCLVNQEEIKPERRPISQHQLS